MLVQPSFEWFSHVLQRLALLSHPFSQQNGSPEMRIKILESKLLNKVKYSIH